MPFYDNLFFRTKNKLKIKFDIRKRNNLHFLQKHYFSNESKYFKVGIIGSGPSALYCCKHFLKNDNIKVDIFDKLPNPYGLIRYGVAPDHISVKNIYKTFNPVLLNKEKYRFFGNVNIGIDIQIEDLRNYYNAVIFCCGASESSLPKEEIYKKENGIFHAKDLIYFYNNFYDDLRCKSIDTYLNTYENFSNSIIIGNGNVSLDIARILIKSYDDLIKTDINFNYLNIIKRHNFKHIYIIGRRGFWQSSFTNSELRELFSLKDTKVILDKKNYDLCFEIKNYDETNKMKQRQNKLFLDMVHNYEQMKKNPTLYDKYKIIQFIFYHEIRNIHNINNHLKEIQLGLNKDIYSSQNNHTNNKNSYDINNQKINIKTPLLIFATGFKKDNFSLNFYNKSVDKYKDDILNKKFAIFKAGWFQTGAKGNIASHIINTKQNTTEILNFLNTTTIYYENDITELLKRKKVHFVSMDQWNYIQSLEKNNGEQSGRCAQKFAKVKDILHILSDKRNE